MKVRHFVDSRAICTPDPAELERVLAEAGVSPARAPPTTGSGSLYLLVSARAPR